jgi:hypothetical protein
MRHQVVWAACAVTNPDTGDEKILNRGDMLPEWVSEFTRSILTGAGAVKVVEGDEPAPEAPDAPAEPEKKDEQQQEPPAPPAPEPPAPAAPAATSGRAGSKK